MWVFSIYEHFDSEAWNQATYAGLEVRTTPCSPLATSIEPKNALSNAPSISRNTPRANSFWFKLLSIFCIYPKGMQEKYSVGYVHLVKSRKFAKSKQPSENLLSEIVSLVLLMI
jgi:hypothetical protein